MTTNRTLARRSARRTFRPRIWASPPGLALLGLALVGLLQAGCASDGCSNCGGFASRISNGVQSLSARVFRHFDGCGGGADCGCGSEGSIVDSGTPIISGGMALPAPGTIIQAPAIESGPTQLEAIPNSPPTSGASGAATGASPASNRSTPSGNNRSAYTTMAPKGGTATRRGTDVARALHSSPDASTRPAGSNASDVMDSINIPPVDLPSDVTRKAASASPANAPAATPATTPTPVSDTVAPTPAEKVSAAEGAIGSLPPIDASAAYRAPGIRRFASIAPSVGGGSAPSMEGLDWLKEKGYRTFIDLRRSSEIEANFADAVNDRNMVYISLPIVANRLDSSRLARFDDLISQSDNRPLFFCDTDGTRAGLVWYIHLRSVAQEDSQVAVSKSEEIGLTPIEAKLAEDFLATHKPRARAATARVASAIPVESASIKTESASSPTAGPAPAASALPTSNNSALPTVKPVAAPVPSADPTPAMLPGEDRPQASARPASAPDVYRDPAFWRPVAALVLTGLGVPLAYWSRSALSAARSVRIRASLPGSVPQSLETPAASDA